jgi:virulence-associated protein VapD
MAERAKRKQIAFDLDTAELKAYYPTNNWQHAYDDIKRHMTRNGFLWRQGSVYVSKNPVNSYQTDAVLSALTTKHPWLNVCMRDCVVTTIEREHSLNHMFDRGANIKKREEKTQPKDKSNDTTNQDSKTSQSKPGMSMND